ncbi:MAG: hypothetical protein HY996_06710 [Micrococcales bacterium]|nr:hypothetical protein [Micrococcales bacterium]
MDDAAVIDERFWRIAEQLGPVTVEPERRIAARATEIAVLVVTGPLVVVAMAWSLVAVALGL